MADYVNLIAAVLAVVAAIGGFAGFGLVRSRRQKLAAIGTSFASLAQGFGSNQLVDRLTSAALLPRFFDRESEYSLRAGKTPYASDAIRLAAAILKVEPTGTVQKSLADGLSKAPTLARVDFQGANLRMAYWGSGGVEIGGADFFRADLSGASLRGAKAARAVFQRAQLVGTTLEGADLRDADLRAANVRNALFRGAQLHGAKFAGSFNLPGNVAQWLDSNGVFTSTAPFDPDAIRGDFLPPNNDPRDSGPNERRPLRVFLSKPSVCGPTGEVVEAQVRRGIEAAGAELEIFAPAEYGSAAPLDEVKYRIRQCDAVVVVGVPQYEAASMPWRTAAMDTPAHQTVFATPWNHIEAGMAAALDKPMLLVRRSVTEGVFAIGDQPHAVSIIDVASPDDLSTVEASVRNWVMDAKPSPSR